MSLGAIGIILTLIGIALTIHFGLHSFTSGVSEKVDTLRKDLTKEFSGIKENITKISGRAEDIWQWIKLYITTKQKAGTIEVILKNFGKTKVSAEPSITDTKYIIQPEKGNFNADIVAKLSNKSCLVKKELELFNKEPLIMSLGNALKIVLPSTDPDICVKYINILLTWLDTDYIQALPSEIEKFEKDIKI